MSSVETSAGSPVWMKTLEEQLRVEIELRDSFYAGVLSDEIKVSPGAPEVVASAHRRLSERVSP